MSVTVIDSLPPNMQFVAGLGRQEFSAKTADEVVNRAGSEDLVLYSEAHSGLHCGSSIFTEMLTELFSCRSREAHVRVVEYSNVADWAHCVSGLTLQEAADAPKLQRPEFFLSAEDLERVKYSPSTLLHIRRRGLSRRVQAVIAGVRRYFPHENLFLEWVEGPDSARPVAISIDVDYSNDAWAAAHDAFESDWWFKQDVALHESVGVHLA